MMAALANRMLFGCKGRLSYLIPKEYQYRMITGQSSRKAVVWKRPAKLAALGIGLGVFTVGSYAYEMYKRRPILPIANPTDEEVHSYILREQPPTFAPARKIVSKADGSGLKLTLFQYQTCPFCCKVRAFLDYFGFSYDVIEVNSVTRTQTKWTDYRKVPFLIVENPQKNKFYQLKDSSVIISALYSLLVNPEMSVHEVFKSYPITSYTDDDGKQKKEIMNRYFLMYGEIKHNRSKDDIAGERKWRRWVDDVFVHTLSPNVYRTPDEAFQAFNWFSEVGEWEMHFSTWERLLVIYVGSAAMYFIGKNLKRRHLLKDDVRQSLYDESNLWLKNINKKGGPFMGGDEPDISDLNVYGILTAIEGCDAFQDLISNTKIKNWYFQMKGKVKRNEGSGLLSQRGVVV